MKVWIVGEEGEFWERWELKGIYSTEEKALSACKDKYHFVTPVEVDTEMLDDEEWWLKRDKHG